MWKVVLTKQANKDAKKLTAAGLKSQTEALLAILAENPYQPPSEKLKGDLSGYYSRRITAITDQTNHKKNLKALLCNAFKFFLGLGLSAKRCNIQHRLVYQIMSDEKVVKVLRMWSHYE
jgi:toxin YoeB